MIPDSFKQDLLNRVDIVEVVSRYVQLKKGGANYLGLCPFHGEKTPSFTVSPAKQFYHCFGCGAHGNAIGFLMAYAGLGYVEALRDLAGSAGMQLPESRPRTREEAAREEREADLGALLEQAMGFYRAELKKSPRAIEYLKARGLSGEVAARFRLGYAPDDWQALRGTFADYDARGLVECGLVIENEGKRYDRFRDRIMFPILSNRGMVIGFGARVLGQGEPKYLNSPETPLFEKGRELYGLPQARDAIRTAGRAVVVEGYMDVISLAQHGVGYAVATLGTATTPHHVSRLLRLADQVVFCFDGDAAGRKAAWRALEVSLPLAPDHKPIRFLFLPQGEDPDSSIRAHGAEAFERAVREAQTLGEFLISELRARCGLESPEARSRFLVEARPLVQKIEASGLRLQLVKQLAELARVDSDEAHALLQLSGASRDNSSKPRARAGFQTRQAVPLERKLLTRALARLDLVLEADIGLMNQELPETRAFQELVERVRSLADPAAVKGGAIVELFEGLRYRQVIADAYADLSVNLKLDEDQAVAEFHEFLKLLCAREREADRSLREKVLAGTATSEERRLFEEKHRNQPGTRTQ